MEQKNQSQQHMQTRLLARGVVRQSIGFMAGIISILVLLAASGVYAGVYERVMPQANSSLGQVNPDNTFQNPPQTLNFQGSLRDPRTGGAKEDGEYKMTFRFYNAAEGGDRLWEETKVVVVKQGLFSTNLGDTEPFNGLFNGQNLWMGIQIEGDDEATPRQAISSVGYALYADNASTLSGIRADQFSQLGHVHAGTDITSGIIGEAYIDSAIARVSNIWSIVVEQSAAGLSGLNADTLDGINSSDFASVRHNHSGADITTGTVTEAHLADNVVPKFLALNPYSAYLEGNAGFADGYGPNSGLYLPKANSSSFTTGFVLPPNYTTGGQIALGIMWHTRSTKCDIVLAPKSISIARPGSTHLIGSSEADGIEAASGSNIATATSEQYWTQEKFYRITDPTGGRLQASDAINFTLLRADSSNLDTCDEAMIIQGIYVRYE